MSTISQESYTLGNSFKRKKYLRYDGGGPIDPNTASAVVGSGGSSKGAGFSNAMSLAPMATGILDSFDSGNEFGRQSTGVSIGKGALTGAEAGMAFGPIGAGVGALVGGVTSWIGSNKAKKAEEDFKNRQKVRQKQTDANFMQSRLGADPSLYQGNMKAEYFETGGSLSNKFKQFVEGGPVLRNVAESTGNKIQEKIISPTYKRQDTIKGITKEEFDKIPHPDTRSFFSDSRAKERGKQFSNAVSKITAVTSYVPHPLVKYPSMILNSTLGGFDAYDSYKDGDNVGAIMNIAGAIPLEPKTLGLGSGNIKSKIKEGLLNTYSTNSTAMDLTDNYGRDKKENGGSLSSKFLNNTKAEGGSVNQQSSDGVEFNGNSHNEGGIKLPQIGVEVEGKETAKDDYVFSDKLGFAKLHKPIMNAKGKIESKPYTLERKNAINLLNEQEDKLKFAQEFVKSRLNIQ